MSDISMTFVLVPGAWQGGWSWEPVAQRLRAAGHVAVTITLPGLAGGDSRSGLHLSDAVDHVAGEIEKRDLSNVVLVGHSWGGYPITGAAHRVAHRLAKIVYFNAFVPARGVPFIDENQDYAAILRAAIDASPDGSVSVTFEQVPVLMPELPEAAQRLFHELLVPQPGTYFLQSLDVDDVTTLGVPAAYVLSENDLALARPGTELAARIGLTPLMVPGGHQSMLTHPDEVAEVLLKY
ncbi:alpha/beta fold hydrolase [Nonomuraea aridisoli]|uniref:Alpha/beta hydrolase n=1 Tax=Nonomuraea aridisoli TaxID=2070368 RepID=A0A2W2DLR9_9ACTN|nr:alpha/beta hydrolase [Nonomuraea aridisoli]PZG06075.1 alpha/beta hydrolase [Nonomuraea aridisoli]